MNPSKTTNEATRQEWRDLGFFYDVIEDRREWLIRGDRNGLLRFADLLSDYSANSRNASLSEHDHYGPYSYLKIVTWSSADINRHDIRGTIEDLKNLGQVVREAMKCTVSNEFVVREAFAPGALYSIRFMLEPDGFDPSSADIQLTE